MVKTDELKIGDTASERAHSYVSPQASEPYEIVSRYEWGVDTYYRGYERPKSDPENFAEFEFEADAGKPYHIWVRGRSQDNNIKRDAFWMQFNAEIGTQTLGPTYGDKLGFGNWLETFARSNLRLGKRRSRWQTPNHSLRYGGQTKLTHSTAASRPLPGTNLVEHQPKGTATTRKNRS